MKSKDVIEKLLRVLPEELQNEVKETQKLLDNMTARYGEHIARTGMQIAYISILFGPEAGVMATNAVEHTVLELTDDDEQRKDDFVTKLTKCVEHFIVAEQMAMERRRVARERANHG